MEIRLTCQPVSQGQECTVEQLVGDLWVRGKGSEEHYVGQLYEVLEAAAPIRLVPSTDRPQSAHHTLKMGIDVDRRRLEAIEGRRQGGDLTFSARLVARVRDESGITPTGTTKEYTAYQSAWTKVLDDIGYLRIVLIEVPMPDADTFPELEAAIEYLVKAQAALVRHHHREAVGCCRDALEALSVALGDRDDQDVQFGNFFGATKRMNKLERIRLVRGAIKILTHPARHADEAAARIEWEPVDATAMVSMVAALLQVASPRS